MHINKPYQLELTGLSKEISMCTIYGAHLICSTKMVWSRGNKTLS